MGTQEREEGPATYDDTARPQHRVTITNPFYLGKYPVTRREYATFVQATGPRPPGACWTYEKGKDGTFGWLERLDRDWRHPGFAQTARDPVVCVNVTDVRDFAAWLSHETKQAYRLPSEAEWEYAARAGTTTTRFWGDNVKGGCRYANLADRSLAKAAGESQLDPEQYVACSDSFAYTAPVGSFRPNAFGLYDMLGNVWHWTADPWHDNYAGAPSDGSVWERNGEVGRWALRGGSWSYPPADVRADVRFMGVSVMRFNTVGFRLAESIPYLQQ